MKVAVEGCAHGELDKIYETIAGLEERHNMKIDLLLICGDFQSVRNTADMECMAVPPKYRHMQTFYKYYNGEKVAPILTIFIGGNHEASNYLSELPYGGWVCPNIYYMGYANVINVGGLRIAGLSGIYKPRDYMRGHFEILPYNESSKKSVYHIRNLEVFRLKQIQLPVDIILSHDWPTGVYNYGDKNGLLKYKPFFKSEIEKNILGSTPAKEILDELKPKFWFSAHLHCKFTALVPHEDKSRPQTKFLALDKCLPRRNFLQVLDFEGSGDDIHIEYDPEWLSILISTNHLINTSRGNTYLPGKNGTERWDFTPTEEEMNNVKKMFHNELRVPNNFTVTAPTHGSVQKSSLEIFHNPQTQKFCTMLNIDDPIDLIQDRTHSRFTISDFSSANSSSYRNTDEVSSTDDGSVGTSKREHISRIFDNVPDKKAESANASDFFIDTTGAHAEDSDIFYIDKTGFKCDNTSDNEVVPGHNSTSDPSIVTPNVPVCKTQPVDTTCTMQSQSSFLLCSTPITSELPTETFPELKETERKRKSSDDSEEIAVPVKKFQRRNYSMYKNSDLSTETFSELKENDTKCKNSDSEVAVPVKKFQRRNYDMYKNDLSTEVFPELKESDTKYNSSSEEVAVPVQKLFRRNYGISYSRI